MNTFGERLTLLRKERGYSTRNEFADTLGIPSTTLRNYEMGTREPGHTFLKQMSEYFNVSVDYLLGLTDDRDVLNNFRLRSSEQSLIEKYRSLDDAGKEHVSNLINWETERMEQIRSAQSSVSSEEPIRLVRYYQRLASAGSGEVVFDDGPDERIEIPDIPEYRRVAYAITVNGHSMEPLYYDGDTLLVEVARQIERGEVGIFIIGDRAFVKKLGETELISLNEGYDNIPLTEDAKCMGRVVGKL